MAVFFRIKFFSGVLHVRIKTLFFHLGFDVKLEHDGALINSKKRKLKLKSGVSKNRELVAPKRILVTLYKEKFLLRVRVGKRLFLLDGNDEFYKLIIFLDLIKNSRGAVLGENRTKTAFFGNLQDFDMESNFLVKLHLISIISYVFKILKTSKSKGENINGSNV